MWLKSFYLVTQWYLFIFPIQISNVGMTGLVKNTTQLPWSPPTCQLSTISDKMDATLFLLISCLAITGKVLKVPAGDTHSRNHTDFLHFHAFTHLEE